MNGINCAMVPLEAERLANTMAHLLKHPRVAQRIAAIGFKTISPWTWDAIARKKMALIKQLMTDYLKEDNRGDRDNETA